MAYQDRHKRRYKVRKKRPDRGPFTGRYKRLDGGQGIRQGKVWQEFVDWCARRQLKALPAHPWTVAAYVRWAEPRIGMENVLKSLQEINRVHLLKCHKTLEDDPIVLNTLSQIEVLERTKASRAGLFQADDFSPDSIDEPETPEPPEASEPTEQTGQPARIRRVMRNKPKLVRRDT